MKTFIIAFTLISATLFAQSNSVQGYLTQIKADQNNSTQYEQDIYSLLNYSLNNRTTPDVTNNIDSIVSASESFLLSGGTITQTTGNVNPIVYMNLRNIILASDGDVQSTLTKGWTALLKDPTNLANLSKFYSSSTANNWPDQLLMFQSIAPVLAIKSNFANLDPTTQENILTSGFSSLQFHIKSQLPNSEISNIMGGIYTLLLNKPTSTNMQILQDPTVQTIISNAIATLGSSNLPASYNSWISQHPSSPTSSLEP